MIPYSAEGVALSQDGPGPDFEWSMLEAAGQSTWLHLDHQTDDGDLSRKIMLGDLKWPNHDNRTSFSWILKMFHLKGFLGSKKDH